MICIYCLKEFTAESLTNEHIIPESLGSRLVLRKAACKKCNSEVSNEWDSFLANSFPPTVMARAELDLRGHSGSQPEVDLTGIDPNLGQVDFLLKRGDDGGVVLAKPTIRRKGQNLIAISPTEQQLMEMLRRKGVRFKEIAEKGVINIRSFETKDRIDWNRGHRAAAKILYCYFLLELGEQIFDSPIMDILRKYFLSESGDSQILPDVSHSGPFEVPAHHHILMFDSYGEFENCVCLFRVFWFKFSLDLSRLSPQGRMIGINPLTRSIVESIARSQEVWRPRDPVTWGWKR